MRAWQVQGRGQPREVLHEVELPLPEPGPGQIRIKVTAAGIGLPDVFMCSGIYPLTPPLPFTCGQEACGVVTALGEGVEGLELGQTVMTVTSFTEGHGSFAEECLAIAGSTHPTPTGLSDAEAAGFWIPHMTGWIGLVDRGQLKAGEWLAVLGAAGGSGIAAVQIGRSLGARVIAVVSSDEKADFCRDLGADVIVKSGDGSLAEQLREATGGEGVDVIYDPVGGKPAEDAFMSMRRGGRLLLIGFASGHWPRIDPHLAVVTNTSIVGVLAGGVSRQALDDIHASLSRLVADGQIRNAVTRQYPFEDLPEAVQAMADRAVVGKLVMLGT
jgi:NADPH2:quinone reductase